MSKIKCPQCGNEMQKNEENCPLCGVVLSKSGNEALHTQIGVTKI